jgi:hypothetical protein
MRTTKASGTVAEKWLRKGTAVELEVMGRFSASFRIIAMAAALYTFARLRSLLQQLILSP